MSTVAVVLSLLLAVVLSDLLARMLPLAIPRPLIQIGIGVLIAASGHFVVTLDPDIFFLLFLPPLLFLDGWRIPSEELSRDRATIFELAFGLVLFTVLGMGLFIHWLLPALPLAVGFALAAVLSPTDPIAVSAIARRVPMPRRMMHILEGESLLNDASGLVCFRFAVAAVLTGSFSLASAVVDLAWVAAGGIAVGVGLTLALSWLKNQAAKRLGEDSGSQILISLLIPFGCYQLAESLACSGILAAVAAGLTMSYVESSGQAQATTRIRRNVVWSVIQFSANGIIFVLLGEQLHEIASSMGGIVQLTGHPNAWWLALYILAINLGLAGLRLLWVLVSLRLLPFRHRARRSKLQAGPGWRLVLVMSLSGVRGAVTLAAVMTLPLTLVSGEAFPGRDLCILLAMGVITLSLIVASIFLPLLLKGLRLQDEPTNEAEESSARVAAAHAAIREIERLQQALAPSRPDADIESAAASRVMELYRSRIDNRAGDAASVSIAKRSEQAERDMRLAGLRAERSEIFDALRARRLGSETARRLIRELDLLEARYTS